MCDDALLCPLLILLNSIHFSKIIYSQNKLFFNNLQFQKIYEGWIILAVAINAALSDSVTISSAHPEKCRARAALLDRAVFALYTCADCYTYLFPAGKELFAINGLLVSLNGTVHTHGQFLVPDVHNATNVNLICATLNR